MNNRENKQVSYLTLLICYTLFTVVLTAESLLLGWEMPVVLELLAGLVVGWGIHIFGNVSDSVKKWLYFSMTMIAYFFYGRHATSFFDLAPVMTGVIMIYFAAGLYSMILPCVLVYFAVLFYDIAFVLEGSVEFSSLNISRIMLHCLLVLLAQRLTKLLTDRRVQERKEMDVRIGHLEETNRRTEDFLTNVSHELRTPVNAVTGLTAVMLKNEEDPGKRENILSVQKAGHRLFRQIEDILDYTEISTGKVAVSEDMYMISSLVNDIIVENRMMGQKAGTELIFDIDAKIPAMLIGDGKKIKKIIKHLLDNSMKFTDGGGIYVRVYALSKPYGINLCICVKDTGIGMDEQSLEKITERFYQSSSGRSRKARGLGLGIPIVYGMVKAMEGFVHVESKAGSGTTVSVSIPQKVADDGPGMKVEDPAALCLGCYLKPDKYKVVEVRKFYDEMISHIACGLDVTVHRVFSVDELDMLLSMYRLTHLFLAREEYEEDRDYFEELAGKLQVVVVADEDFVPAAGSRTKLLIKPFYCFPVVNLLNSVRTQESEEASGRRMICPGIRALVVDDEPMNLMVAEGIFRDYQMKVRTAGSGREAIRICEEEDFDLVFLDHMMPEMDGVETLKQLRRVRPDADHLFTAIAFTANAISGAKEMFLREGFDEFLSKPIEDLELERVLRKVLTKAQIRYVEEGSVQEAAPEAERETVGEVREAAREDAVAAEEAPADREDEMARLEKAGISTASGLMYCRRNRNFYLQLLEKFVQESGRRMNEIESLYGQGEYDGYCIQVHALKSTAKMIGADGLSETAKNMEDAAKRKDAEYLHVNHERLLAEYREAVEKIRDAAGIGADTGDGDEDGENAGAAAEISAEELLERLQELKQSLETFELDQAQKQIEELDGTVCQGKPVRKMLREVSREVEEFEFESAGGRVEQMIRSVKGGETHED